MTAPKTIERRDPVSPLLQLGGALACARLEKRSGRIRVLDRGEAYIVSLYCGSIVNFSTQNPSINQVSGRKVHEHVSRLFQLPRPRVLWDSKKVVVDNLGLLDDPAKAIIHGVRSRADLFDPVSLVERIPSSSLAVDAITLNKLASLPFSSEELDFFWQLVRPTPVTMILWKRGLPPQYAGALLMTLNLLGVWRDFWQPGLLPREVPRPQAAAEEIPLELTLPTDDYAVLGVTDRASDREIDLAFRKLSFELHPDKQEKLHPSVAHDAFADLSAAYTRVKRSRRKRPVVDRARAVNCSNTSLGEEASWLYYYQQARQAEREKNHGRARAFAVKTLSSRPPRRVQEELRSLLERVA